MDSSIRSLNIAQEFTIQAPKAKVFEGLVEDVGAWWSHSFEENPKGIRMEAKLGGLFYEDWGNGSGAIYATVMMINKGSKLKLMGAMGMSGPVLGTIEFELENQGNSTLVKLHHRALGEISDEAISNYTGGWTELLGTNFRQFIERGTRIR